MSLLTDEPLGPRVTVRAPAKINLYLGVAALAADGFHPLTTVFQAVGLYDDVTVSEATEWSLRVVGDPRLDLEAVPTDDSNIALRAARRLLAHHGMEHRAAAMTIHKSIPVAGGMAGGSADAAAALVAVDRALDLQTSDDDLLAIAAELGSDVPFSLLGGTAVGRGRGEQLEDLEDAGGWWWVVIESDEGLSTPAVYRAFDELHAQQGTEPDPHALELPTTLVEGLVNAQVDLVGVTLWNDLQEPALHLRPDLRRTLEDAGSCGRGAVLSGSGPTVLVLCASREEADAAREKLAGLGHERVTAVPAPVAGVHVVEHA
ncbi:4-(cytidine 5'-diphospho)-2-C-methyl-D-erythritol kinase [Nocardioides bruguierae]|uniref:4-(cytidine 5'-diphospho)-2-C-methyl-D-erythritol kinase n=1 Tax=Nocardioides bruguierae TaxID=2945102 RepID=UPI0020210AB5|nr:4-(cytidine 5'-diphospho)-2-C-methyl-D-erythritol kinase [Nocardioides bruguierae]MCL8024995.1 4-(cytidine 5'-diphospho)-2-C-methyl-D-erythritol kinase [Nocardioides bruguierae]